MLLEVVKDLYIMRRSKWIKQKDDGSYIQLNYSLHDNEIIKHLKGSQTLGVFAGKFFTNFICFDIDKGKKLTERLLEVLKEDYGFKDDEILTTFSGSKGYHVEIFYEEPVPFKQVELFYLGVLDKVGCSRREIELRPTPTQGVKLPLSFNRKTGKLCYVCSNKTLRQVKSERLGKIQKIVHNEAWSKPVVYDFEDTVEGLKLDIPIDYEHRCFEMLTKNKLLYPDSRHSSSLLLLAFLHERGYDEEEAVRVVSDVIRNTYKVDRELISEDTTLEYSLSEIRRLWKWASKYRLGAVIQKVARIYDVEVKAIFERVDKMALRRLLFSLLVHSKKWANKDGIFYMTYAQMEEMGNDSKRSRLLSSLMTLEELDLIEIVERNRKRLPNKYRVKIRGKSTKYLDIDLTSLEDVVSQLLAEAEIKKYVSRKQFYTLFKHYY